jgi:hypothetical protein
MTNALTTTKSIELFKGLFEKGMQKIQEACEVYVKSIDADDKAQDKFKEAFPHIPAGAWNKFELVGRKQMLPELMTDTTPMAEKLKKLPISSQARFYGKSQQLVTKTGDLLNVSFHHATKEQARQIFASDHIRTPAEQRAWIENTKRGLEKKEEIKPEKVYDVKNGKLVVLEPCSFTKDQLIQILAEV